MLPRPLVAAAVTVGLAVCCWWLSGAQADPAPVPLAPAAPRIVVVDVCELVAEWGAVNRLRRIADLLEQLRALRDGYYRRRIANVQQELDALAEYGQRDTSDWNETAGMLQRLRAERRAAADIDRVRTRGAMAAAERVLGSALQQGLEQLDADLVLRIAGDPHWPRPIESQLFATGLPRHLGTGADGLYCRSSSRIPDGTLDLLTVLNRGAAGFEALDRQIIELETGLQGWTPPGGGPNPLPEDDDD